MVKKMTAEELKRLARNGKVETPEGKVVKPWLITAKKKPESVTEVPAPAPMPIQAPVHNDEGLVNIMQSASDRLMQLIASLANAVLQPQTPASLPAPQVTVHAPASQPITRWKFTVERDPQNGLIREIIAIAVEE